VPDHRRHRGAHPADGGLFADERIPALRQATSDLSWLLTRDYAPTSALKLVGDRYSLTDRQRLAVARAAASERQRQRRRERCLGVEEVADADLLVDGFNLIITVEAALSGGLLIRCRDDCVRDLSSVHGSYRSVEETARAISLIGETLAPRRPRSVTLLLDKPVSNSGRLAQKIALLAAENGWPWRVEVVMNPDKVMLAAGQIVLTSDSVILDGVAQWVNFGALLVRESLPESWVIDLSG
jgi:hypothetical protein